MEPVLHVVPGWKVRDGLSLASHECDSLYSQCSLLTSWFKFSNEHFGFFVAP